MTGDPDLNILIYNKGDQFELIAFGFGGHTQFLLPKSKSDLLRYIKSIDNEIQHIIGDDAYSTNFTISSDICRKHLRKLADLKVLENILLGNKPVDKAIKFVKTLKENSTKRSLRIQVISEFVPIPWTLFYDEDLEYGSENVNPNAFWGFKHIIDTPVPVDGTYEFPDKIGKTDITLSLNTAFDIDQNLIDEQKKFFSSIADQQISFKLRENEDDVIKAFMEKSGFMDAVLYFFCHGNSPLDIVSLLKDTYIRMTTIDKAISMQVLNNWSDRIIFSNDPFVFINACESLSMNPMFYEGMVPFFFNKGSVGVLGTISKIPALFASKFALEFFKLLLNYQPVGKILLQIRKKFCDPPYNNPLGLFYLSYCHSELELKR